MFRLPYFYWLESVLVMIDDNVLVFICFLLIRQTPKPLVTLPTKKRLGKLLVQPIIIYKIGQSPKKHIKDKLDFNQ